ncbi:CDGP domain-containing protein [Mycobacterium sp.]|uniref:CDGP domain-containing protein n=1 Tax=Mycobacterium sp. TaxID=1785 RepID=UPI003C706BAD
MQEPLWAEHPFAQECDGPIQPDGTWQRCMTTGQPPGIPILSSPSTHIDDDLSN